MLVLSRSEGDGISFPELDMAIEVLKVQGTRVQIGVRAAEEIRVLRSELLGRVTKKIEPSNADARHLLRNRLNAVSLAMSISQKHLERGDIKNAELALRRVSCKFCDNTEQGVESGNEAVCSSTEPSASELKPLNVLLVEDNINEGSLLAEILSLNNVKVRIVRDGKEALLALKQSMPDVVLLDMHMPDCDGKATLEQIRKDRRLRSLPVYAVTGADQAEMGIKVCQEQGVHEWFQKPVQSQALMHALKTISMRRLPC